MYTDQPRKDFTQWFSGVVDREITNFIRQAEEVDKLAWIDMEQMKQDIQDNPDKYIPTMPAIVVELGL